jgi:hypothetical protein
LPSLLQAAARGGRHHRGQERGQRRQRRRLELGGHALERRRRDLARHVGRGAEVRLHHEVLLRRQHRGGDAGVERARQRHVVERHVQVGHLGGGAALLQIHEAHARVVHPQALEREPARLLPGGLVHRLGLGGRLLAPRQAVGDVLPVQRAVGALHHLHRQPLDGHVLHRHPLAPREDHR